MFASIAGLLMMLSIMASTSGEGSRRAQYEQLAFFLRANIMVELRRGINY